MTNLGSRNFFESPVLQALTALLPPADPVAILRSEVDYYGISTILARLLRLPDVPPSNAGWCHAWNERPTVSAEIFVHAVPQADRPLNRVLVSRKDEEKFMLEQGFVNTRAVGCPFTYVPAQGMIRQENTLLIMPHHLSAYMEPDEFAAHEQEYLEKLRPFLNRFRFVAMCVHASCYASGAWLQVARSLGIPVIPGAHVTDRNALIRMRRLFETFSHVTTNCIGSHVAYATFCGARLSWFCDSPPFNIEKLRLHTFHEKNPGYLEQVAQWEAEDFWGKTYGFLRANPDEAEFHREWATEQLGADNKIPVRELGLLLGWAPHEQGPSAEAGHAKKSLARDKTWENRIAQKQQRVETLENSLSKRKARVDDLEKSVAKLQQSIAARQQEMKAFSGQLSEAIRQLYASRRWKLGGKVLHPFGKKQAKPFAPLEDALRIAAKLPEKFGGPRNAQKDTQQAKD